MIQIPSRNELIRTKEKRETSDEESSGDETEINMGIERVTQEKEQQHMTSNPLVHTPVTGKVHICTGCNVLFTNRECKQPHDLVIRIQMRRQYKKWAKENSSEEKQCVLQHEGFGLCMTNNRICMC